MNCPVQVGRIIKDVLTEPKEMGKRVGTFKIGVEQFEKNFLEQLDN